MPHPYDGQALSYGGGVNSTALAVLLIGEGWRGPVVWADVGAEWPETVEYITTFTAWLEERELTLTRVGPEWRRGIEQLTLIDYCEHYRVTPFPKRRWCTQRWKTDPLERWCAANGYAYQDMLLGIAADEAHRQPEKCRPLVDRGIDRAECVRIIEAAGIEVPRLSGCYICPFQRRPQWYELWHEHPDLFERAAALEEAATERRGEKSTITMTISSRITSLRELERGFAAQTTMFDMYDY